MTPKRNHRSSGKGRKATRHHQAININTDLANHHTSSIVNTSSVGNPTLTNAYESTNANSSSHGQQQANSYSTYIYFDRPWEQQSNVENYLSGETGTLPMERWQARSMLDEPWHGMDGVVIRGEQIYAADMSYSVINDSMTEGLHEETEEAGSMVCVAHSSEKGEQVLESSLHSPGATEN